MDRRLVCIAIGLASGCLLNTQGSGMTGAASSTTDTDSGGTTSSGTTQDASSTTSASTTVDPTASETTATTGSPGEPLLTLSIGAGYDFGVVSLSAPGRISVDVVNEGDRNATGITARALGSPFGFVGGEFPGTGGDCLSSLAVGASCSFEIEADFDVFGPANTILTLDYDGGTRSVDATLLGEGLGTTDNLIANGDAEMLGAPPPAWTVVDGDDWSAGGAGIAPHSGSAHFNPGTPGVLQAELEQLVDLSAFATYVDTGTTQLDFIGYGASLGDGNDDYRIELFVLDANGDSLVEFDTDWRTHTGWEPAEYGAMAPVGTRAVRVRLRCRYSGGARCDGYFDDLDLTATYSGD